MGGGVEVLCGGCLYPSCINIIGVLIRISRWKHFCKNTLDFRGGPWSLYVTAERAQGIVRQWDGGR